MNYTNENIVNILIARKLYILKLFKDNDFIFCKNYCNCIFNEIDILIKLLSDKSYFDLLASNFKDFMRFDYDKKR